MTEVLLILILAAVAIGRLPPFRMNRASLSLLGAVALVAVGAITLRQAMTAIDLNTLALLTAMMIFTANLKLAGFFQWTAAKLAPLAHSPRTLLFIVLVLSAGLSGLLINDTVALMLTPLLIELTLGAGLNPLPYLIGLALSSNIGSMATIVGNPQNILIGASSGMSFGTFTGALILPALMSLALTYGFLLLMFRRDLRRRTLTALPQIPVRLIAPMLIKAGLSFGLMVLTVLLGWNLTLAALSGASILLVTRRIKPDRVFKAVDWSLLVFFAALFVITRALEINPFFSGLLAWSKPLMAENLPLLAGLTALWSNLVSNVPAVMILKNFVPAFPEPHKAYLVLASASTLAGNLTLLGSVCNLIVAEFAERRGIRISFWAYFKIGFPIAVASLALTTLWVMSH